MDHRAIAVFFVTDRRTDWRRGGTAFLITTGVKASPYGTVGVFRIMNRAVKEGDYKVS